MQHKFLTNSKSTLVSNYNYQITCKQNIYLKVSFPQDYIMTIQTYGIIIHFFLIYFTLQLDKCLAWSKIEKKTTNIFV